MKITVDLGNINDIVKEAGADPDGPVQWFLTNTINRRIGRYMPHLTGFLETKSKRVVDATTIEVAAIYAQYQYYGKVMVGPPPKVVTDRDLVYTKTFNPLAGPFWDRRMMAAEGDQIAKEVEAYANRTR